MPRPKKDDEMIAMTRRTFRAILDRTAERTLERAIELGLIPIERRSLSPRRARARV